MRMVVTGTSKAGETDMTLLATPARLAPSPSFEFFPPTTQAGMRALWQAIRRIEPMAPDFISVTYGAHRSSRERTIEVTNRIVAETTVRPVAPLTAVA